MFTEETKEETVLEDTGAAQQTTNDVVSDDTDSEDFYEKNDRENVKGLLEYLNSEDGKKMFSDFYEENIDFKNQINTLKQGSSIAATKNDQQHCNAMLEYILSAEGAKEFTTRFVSDREFRCDVYELPCFHIEMEIRDLISDGNDHFREVPGGTLSSLFEAFKINSATDEDSDNVKTAESSANSPKNNKFYLS